MFGTAACAGGEQQQEIEVLEERVDILEDQIDELQVLVGAELEEEPLPGAPRDGTVGDDVR